jgi:hypothetical protein
VSLEAERGVHAIVTFPTPEEIVAVVRMLNHEARARADRS